MGGVEDKGVLRCGCKEKSVWAWRTDVWGGEKTVKCLRRVLAWGAGPFPTSPALYQH